MYYCKLFTACNGFAISIYNEEENVKKHFYNVHHLDTDFFSFLEGYVSYPQKIRKKDYDYIFIATLHKSGEYYEYCVNNNIDFPETITFYGYRNK